MSKKTLIAHAVTRLDIGGAQDHLYELIKGMRNHAFDQLVLTGSGGMWIKRFKHIPVYISVNPFLIRQINPIMDILAIGFGIIQLFILKLRYEKIILHSNVPKAGMIYRIAGFLSGIHPNVFTIHGWSFYDMQHPILKKLMIIIEKILNNITDVYISVCKENIHIANRQGINIKDKSIIIYGGVDKRRFTISRNSSDIRNIGTITNFKKMKNNEAFIEIAYLLIQKNSDLRFTIVGDGPQRDEIESLIKKKEIESHIRITGYTNNVEQYLNEMDLLIFTSLWEGLPRVLMESYYAGIPFASFPAGGIKEFAEMIGIPECVSDTFNINELKNIVENIINRSIECIYRKTDIFTADTMIEKHRHIYSILQNAKKCRMQSLSQKENI